MKNLMLFAGVILTILPMWAAIHAKSVPDAAVLGYLAGLYGVLSVRIGGMQEP